MTDTSKRTLYLARFEIGTFGNVLQHPEAVLQKSSQKGTVAGWIDFMTGFPIACIELQALVGEISSRPDLKNNLVESVQDPSGVTPGFPKTLFGGYVDSKILLNLLYLDGDYSDFMADDLKGEPKPAGLHWWLRTNLMSDIGGTAQLFPYISEFVGLAVRLMPDRISFEQESSPFLYSGCFIDSVYLTGGFIKEINDPTDTRPYPTYTIQWRKNPDDSSSDGLIKDFVPTDFTSYNVGDRVFILKDIETTKVSEKWNDDDMKILDGTKCAIVPLMLYGINPDKD